jgi:hypothetical protein
MKLYFLKHGEYAYSLSYFKEYMRNNAINEMEVFEAEIEHGTCYFFCHEFNEIGEVGEGCGNKCKKYVPRNGKNGRCKFSGPVYSPSEKSIILKI